MSEFAAPSPELSPQCLCPLDQLMDGTSRVFDLLRKKKSGRAMKWSIFVVRAGDKVFGYVNKCPHQPVPLDWEGNRIFDADRSQLHCGKHGARFALDDGQCVDGPCLGESLKSVALSIRDGSVYVDDVELAPANTPVGVAL